MLWVVRQPNGLLAIVDSTKSTFSATDLSCGEAFLLLRPAMGEGEARAAVRAGMFGRLPSTQFGYGDGLARWRDALDIFSA